MINGKIFCIIEKPLPVKIIAPGNNDQLRKKNSQGINNLPELPGNYIIPFAYLFYIGLDILLGSSGQTATGTKMKKAST